MEKSEKIKIFRQHKGLTQSEISEKLGIIKQSYSMIELGKNALKIEHLEKLIEMGLNPMWFFLDKGEMLLEEEPVVVLPRYKPFGDFKNENVKKSINVSTIGNNNSSTISINKSELDTLKQLLEEKERTIQILLKQLDK